MAASTPRWCSRCHAAHEGRCRLTLQQTRRDLDSQRGTRQERGYDKHWQALRVQHLQQFPFCADCLDVRRMTPATEVHHMVSIASAPERRLDAENLMSLCRSCHSKRTARGE